MQLHWVVGDFTFSGIPYDLAQGQILSLLCLSMWRLSLTKYFYVWNFRYHLLGARWPEGRILLSGLTVFAPLKWVGNFGPETLGLRRYSGHCDYSTRFRSRCQLQRATISSSWQATSSCCCLPCAVSVSPRSVHPTWNLAVRVTSFQETSLQSCPSQKMWRA